MLAELFTISIDYLLIGTYNEHSTMNNTWLFERFKALISCPQEDQETAIKLIDVVVVKNRVELALLQVDK